MACGFREWPKAPGKLEILRPPTLLQAPFLGDLIPEDVSACCHKMTHFARVSRFPGGRTPAPASTCMCPQLQHLELLDLEESFCIQHLNRQLGHLPNLQGLFCRLQNSHGPRPDPDAADNLLHAIQAVRTHLTYLTLPKAHFDISKLCVNAWPHLQQLDLPMTVLDSHNVRALLRQAPQVTDLCVYGFDMTEDLADEVCSWQVLDVDGISCQSIVWLPLAGLQTWRIHGINLHADEWSTVGEATAVLSSLAHVVQTHPCLSVYVFSGDYITEEDQVPAVVDLLRLLLQEHIKLSCRGKLHKVWCEVLEQLQCRTLSLKPDELWDDWWCTLLQQVPQLEVLHFWMPRHGVDQWLVLGMQLASFCAFAPRPCTLRVDNELAETFDLGWRKQLMSSMQAAGHQRGEIEVGSYDCV